MSPPHVDVALTPAGLRGAPTIVVVDALRATSTVAHALAAGCPRVLCCDDREAARALGGPGRVLAGESRCLPPPGFDLGNSPEEAETAAPAELVLATTNGTRAVVAATRHAPRVLLAGLVNLEAVVEALRGPVLVACAGADGAAGIEDVYVAGRIAEALGGGAGDGALLARAVARAHAPEEAFAAGAAAARLRRVGLERDIAACARESVLDVVPAVVRTGPGVAVVACAPQSQTRVRATSASWASALRT